MQNPIHIAVADDHPVTRLAVRLAVTGHTDVRWVGETDDPAMLSSLLSRLPVDVLITDVSMPSRLQRDGLPMLRMLCDRFPKVRIVVLSMHDNPALIRWAIDAGVSGFVSKRDAEPHLPDAIRAAMQGDYYLAPYIRAVFEAALRRRTDAGLHDGGERGAPISPQLARAGAPARGPAASRALLFGGEAVGEPLSVREAEVVRRYLAGASLAAIARSLGRSVKTVSAQRTAAMRKLWAENDAQLFEFAAFNGNDVFTSYTESPLTSF